MSADPSAYDELIACLEGDGRIVFLTGAGLSAESGVDTFRGDDGLWNEYDPSEVATPQAFEKNPDRVHDFYRMRRRGLEGVDPSFSHETMARLETLDDSIRVITQNVDDLHEQAGQSNVLHVHGELMWDRCVSCDRRVEADPADDDMECESCGGILRPDVVWFGESLDTDKLKTSREWLRETDVLVVVGSSLGVAPVSGFPDLAARAGASLVEVNPKPVLDRQSDKELWIHDGPAETFFRGWLKRLSELDTPGDDAPHP
jgi:NAD-dependent deacetylase